MSMTCGGDAATNLSEHGGDAATVGLGSAPSPPPPRPHAHTHTQWHADGCLAPPMGACGARNHAKTGLVRRSRDCNGVVHPDGRPAPPEGPGKPASPICLPVTVPTARLGGMEIQRGGWIHSEATCEAKTVTAWNLPPQHSLCSAHPMRCAAGASQQCSNSTFPTMCSSRHSGPGKGARECVADLRENPTDPNTTESDRAQSNPTQPHGTSCAALSGSWGCHPLHSEPD